MIVLLWIGGLKWIKYEADGIVPFVATSPLMRWMIKDPENYKAHVNAEGVLNEANRACTRPTARTRCPSSWGCASS